VVVSGEGAGRIWRLEEVKAGHLAMVMVVHDLVLLVSSLLIWVLLV
jgi:hypothetical protein